MKFLQLLMYLELNLIHVRFFSGLHQSRQSRVRRSELQGRLRGRAEEEVPRRQGGNSMEHFFAGVSAWKITRVLAWDSLHKEKVQKWVVCRHVTESIWNLKPFSKPKLKPKLKQKMCQLNCHPGSSPTTSPRSSAGCRSPTSSRRGSSSATGGSPGRGTSHSSTSSRSSRP